MAENSEDDVKEPSWMALANNPKEWANVAGTDPRLDEFAEAVEQRYGLPRGLLVAVKNAGERTPSKSSGRPTVSKAGARGVMQFIDSTRKDYPHNPDDPFASIDAAGAYLKDTLKRYDGDVWAAITEYNGGVHQAKAVKRGGKPWATETINYLNRIEEYMRGKYGD